MNIKNMNVTITKITRQQKVSKSSDKEYESVGMQTQEHGEKWMNGFGNSVNKDWNTGDVIVDIIIEESQWGLQFKDGRKKSETLEILTKLGAIRNAQETLIDIILNPERREEVKAIRDARQSAPRPAEDDGLTSDGNPVPFSTDENTSDDITDNVPF